MATYHTYTPDKGGWSLGPGETLGFTAGKGYYAIPAPTKAGTTSSAPSTQLVNQRQMEVASDYYTNTSPQTVYQSQNPGGTNPPNLGANQNPLAKPAEVPPPELTDWAAYLGLFGLDDEALAAINSVRRTGNISVDSANILNAVRQTQWYAKTYPGIGEAIARGIVSNEADYRQKKNDFDQVYQQNYGRPISAQEYADFLRQGYSADIVNRQIQGDKYIQANQNDIQYAEGNFGDTGQFSGDQLQQIGRNKAGLGTQNGVNLQAQLDKAIARAQRVFQGTLAGMQVNPTNQTGAPAPSNQYPDIGR